MEEVKLVIAEPQNFTDSISAINKLVEETNIVVKSTHLEIVAMDPANVAMVIFKMASSEFVEYKSGTQDSIFGLKLSTLKQVLSRGSKDNILTLVFTDKLVVTFSGKTHKQFTVPLIDTGLKAQKIPDLKFGAEVVIDNSELRDAIADVSIVGEAAEFKVEVDKFIISGSGDSSKAVTETKGSINFVGDKKTLKSKYSIEYLDKMISTKLSKSAKIYLSSEYPIKIHYVNEKATISIDFVLAPRVDNN